MHIARLRFPLSGGAGPDGGYDAVTDLLAALRHNGQVLGREWPIVESGPAFATFLMLPEPTALDPRHHSRWVLRGLERLAEAGMGAPEVTVLGPDPGGAAPCDCAAPAGYALWTTYLSLESPLRCLDCFRPVPLYRLPVTDGAGDHGAVTAWQSDFQSCDTLQMNCRTLEYPALAAMAAPDSTLSRQGRGIADALTGATGRPVHYALYRHHARGRGRERRLTCPSCGGAWRLDDRLHGLFDYWCRACRLLSHEGVAE